MKSIKNHLSLIIALFSILFSVQILIVTNRSVNAYRAKLATNYSIIVVSQKKIPKQDLLKINPLIKNFELLSPNAVIKRLNYNVDKKNIELLKLTLPKFYKIHLKNYPSPEEIKKLTKDFKSKKGILKIEDFSYTHDWTYKLLMLLQNIVFVFSATIFIVTILLISKELKIWQFQHNERMSIMGLFGAPTWLRSAVLFRLAIVDAIISSILIFAVFFYISKSDTILTYFKELGINVVVFDTVNDFGILLGISFLLSIFLATLIMIGHKEEV